MNDTIERKGKSGICCLTCCNAAKPGGRHCEYVWQADKLHVRCPNCGHTWQQGREK